MILSPRHVFSFNPLTFLFSLLLASNRLSVKNVLIWLATSHETPKMSCTWICLQNVFTAFATTKLTNFFFSGKTFWLLTSRRTPKMRDICVCRNYYRLCKDNKINEFKHAWILLSAKMSAGIKRKSFPFYARRYFRAKLSKIQACLQRWVVCSLAVLLGRKI